MSNNKETKNFGELDTSWLSSKHVIITALQDTVHGTGRIRFISIYQVLKRNTSQDKLCIHREPQLKRKSISIIELHFLFSNHRLESKKWPRQRGRSYHLIHFVRLDKSDAVSSDGFRSSIAIYPPK